MRKRMIQCMLAVIMVLASSVTVYASEECAVPLFNAVNDVIVTFSIDSDGVATTRIDVMPDSSDSIDYVVVTASIIKNSTGSAVKTWKNIRVDEPSYIGKFIFAEAYQLTSRGSYHLTVSSIKVYKNGAIVDNITGLTTENDVY